MAIKLENIDIQMGNQNIFNQFGLQLASGEILGILGPSGCGKTTLLRALAGFQSIESGDITVHDRCLACDEHCIAPEKRNISMVFQDHALFPHLSVFENIAFGLNKHSKAEKRARVTELLSMICMQDFADRYPHELSGGQRQRVALARSLAPKPDLILMDEPFSNLDPALREQLATETRALLKQEQTTALLVTHDINDAKILCDQYGYLTPTHLEYQTANAA